jgi:hypothetical protein
MLLNRHRLFLSLAIFLMASFGASCVDIPSAGITPPNYQSSVKYFSYGRGVDTISQLISSISYTAKESLLVLNITGTDTIRVKTRWTYAVQIFRYNRHAVNFGQPLELYVDGSLLTTMSPGQATNYISTPSGSRKIELKGNGTLLDSIRYTKVDTTKTITYDTLRNGTVVGSKIVASVGASATVLVVPASATDKITVDSALIFMETERQISLSMVGDTIANQIGLNGLLRYGRMRYILGIERKTFQPAGKADTALIVVNNFSTIGTVRLYKSSLLKDSVSNLAFKGSSGYRYYPAMTDSTYKFVFRDPTSLAAIDSVSLTVSKGKLYTIAVFDSAGTRKFRAYSNY